MRDSICNDCANRTRCDMAEIGRSPLAISTCYGYEKGNPSNADRIRSMTDEELAVFLSEATSNAIVVLGIGRNEKSKTAFDWYEWLKAPTEEGE